MKTLVYVARLPRLDWINSIAVPWGALTLSWLINMVIFASIPAQKGGGHTGGLATLFAFMLVIGAVTIVRFLPFGLTVGLSRRVYYLGILTFVVSTGVLYAAILTGLNLVESETDGWGIRLHFFRIPWLLDGPWYRTFLTNFVLLVATFMIGAMLGVVYQRFRLVGLTAFLALVAIALTIVSLVITWHHGWHRFGHFVSGLTALGLTGWLALLIVVLGVGEYATIRRATV
ncbi:MAG TPA: hypothetical protein VK662_11460 [Acidothermaceae bacterium]|jgi:hypothetical protein|nr:hypothetical protein [Acidothermaceae bacterium]